MGTQKLLSKSDIILAKRQKLEKQNTELSEGIAWLIMADFKTVEGQKPSTNKQSDAICPKSAVLEISGIKICIEDGEPCVGTPEACFDDKG
jgi:hypothetical protein